MTKIKLCKQEECTGCMACKQKCNNDAIYIKTINGFAYPAIDPNKCKSCGLCSKACPVLNLEDRKGNCHEKETKCFAAWNKDESVRLKSSSGGTFSVLAEYILSQGGVVYGAAWDEYMNLLHKGINSVSELDSLRRSKYVQSDTRNTFVEAKNHLQEGRKVMYCGTPCQIAGLTSFLGGKEYDNLLTVDVLCQGVPSPVFFKKYIEEVENATGMQVTDANFRSKDKGWRCGLLLLLRAQKGSRSRTLKRVLDRNEFYNAFIREYFQRPSCYDCQFKCEKQGYYADLTIADFWRIGNKIPLNVKNYTHGISAVVVNTEKGRNVFQQCSASMEIIERTWNEFATNGGLRSAHKPKNNDEALEYLKTHTWRDTQKRFFHLSWKRKLYIISVLLFGEQTMRNIKIYR